MQGWRLEKENRELQKGKKFSVACTKSDLWREKGYEAKKRRLSPGREGPSEPCKGAWISFYSYRELAEALKVGTKIQ